MIGNDKTVTDIDLHGVSYLAIQGLEERTATHDARIEQIDQKNDELRRTNEMLCRRIEELAGEVESIRKEIR